jgi:hypothetical protein
VCTIPAGVVTVHGNATIASNAALDATGPSIEAGTLTVLGSMMVGPNGILALGCTPEIGCQGTTNDSVAGNLVAFNALGVLLHGDTIGGSVFVQGGGGGVNCNLSPLFTSFAGFPSPVYSTIEDNIVNGSVSVLALRTCWFAVIRDQVKGNVTVDYNTAADGDATEITDNIIGGNLSCFGNNPAAQVGDSLGGPNTVAGKKLGECVIL